MKTLKEYTQIAIDMYVGNNTTWDEAIPKAILQAMIDVRDHIARRVGNEPAVNALAFEQIIRSIPIPGEEENKPKEE